MGEVVQFRGPVYETKAYREPEIKVHPHIYIDARNYNPNRGRIRRWIKFWLKAAVGLGLVYSWWWLAAVMCVGFGYGPEVCGL